MRTSRVNRRIQAFAMHAEGSQFNGDYEEIFNVISQTKIKERYIRIRGEIVIINSCRKKDEFFELEFIITSDDVDPLIVNVNTGEIRVEQLAENETLGVMTHALVHPKSRRILIEYAKSGVKADVISLCISEFFSSKLRRDIRITFSPLIEQNFLLQLKMFSRIRVASVKLSRPNAGWDDHYTKLSKLMDDSDAGKAEINVSAARGESLNKDRGIIKIITQVANDEHPYIMDALIIGNKIEEEGETKLPLHDHVKSKIVNVSKAKDGRINANSLFRKMQTYIASII